MQYVSHSTSISVNASADATLPLFTAEGERLWVNGWEPIYIYPESGEAANGMVWKTLQHDDTEAVWVTVNYDPEQHLATYLKWTPDKHITRIDIQCEAIHESQTRVHVTYSLTALGEAGHADLQKLTSEHYNNWITSWEVAVNHYLAHGKLLETGG